jgi:glutathione S-transferase
MKIHGDVVSPFTRMCLVMAHELGLQDRVSLVKAHAKPTEINTELQRLNPAGKIPVLETDHHHAIHDSRVIMEYLAHVAGNSTMIPDDGVKRFRVLTLMALAQSMADAAVALRYEQAARPPEKHWPEFAVRTQARITAALAEVEHHWQDALSSIHVGTIGLACAIGYMEFRHPTIEWRGSQPKSAAWYATFSSRPGMQAWPLT